MSAKPLLIHTRWTEKMERRWLSKPMQTMFTLCKPTLTNTGTIFSIYTRSNRLGPDPDPADHLKYRPEPVRVPGRVPGPRVLGPPWRPLIRTRSARLLNSFFPQAVRALNSDHPAPLWNPHADPYPPEHGPPPPPPPPPPTSPNLTTPKKKTVWLFVQFKCATHRWVGLLQTTCSNTLFSMRTRHFFLHCYVYTIPQ